MIKKILLLVLCGILLVSFGCQNGEENTERGLASSDNNQPETSDNDDVSDNDDDSSDDDDDDSADDDDNDNQGDSVQPPQIHWPMAFSNQLTSTVIFKVDDDYFDPEDTMVFVDEIEISPVQKMFRMELEDGKHLLSVISASNRFDDGTIEFYVKNNLTERLEMNIRPNRQQTLPQVAAGSGVVYKFTLTNNSGETLTGVWPFSENQPDFRSEALLQSWFDDQCDGKSFAEKKFWLRDEYVGKYFYVSDPAMPANGTKDHPRNVQHLSNMRSWGYGYCHIQASFYNAGAKLAGWNMNDLTEIAVWTEETGGHVLSEQGIAGQAGIADLYGYFIPWDGSNFFSLAEIEVDPLLIYDYSEKDQDGLNLAEQDLLEFSEFFESPDNNWDQPASIDFGEGGALTMYPGDIVELYPWQNAAYLSFCPGETEGMACDPPQMSGTGIWYHELTQSNETLDIPFSYDGLNIQILSSEAGTIEFDLTLNGDFHQEIFPYTVNYPAGESVLDLSDLLIDDQYGEIRNLVIETQGFGSDLLSYQVQIYFQFNPRIIPQLTRENRNFTVKTFGNSLPNINVAVEVNNQAEAWDGAYLIYDPENWEPGVKEEIEAPTSVYEMVRLIAIILNGDLENDGTMALGHKLELVAHHPDVEVIVSPRAGDQRDSPVLSDYYLPRFEHSVWSIRHFYIRAKEGVSGPLGDVQVDLLVNGQVEQTATITFK